MSELPDLTKMSPEDQAAYVKGIFSKKEFTKDPTKPISLERRFEALWEQTNNGNFFAGVQETRGITVDDLKQVAKEMWFNGRRAMQADIAYNAPASFDPDNKVFSVNEIRKVFGLPPLNFNVHYSQQLKELANPLACERGKHGWFGSQNKGASPTKRSFSARLKDWFAELILRGGK